MKRTINVLFWSYVIAGTVWLSLTLYSLVATRTMFTQHSVDGIVKEVISAQWGGIHEYVILVETSDKQGEVLVRSYSGEVEVGDTVWLDLQSGGASGKFLFARIGSSPPEAELGNGK